MEQMVHKLPPINKKRKKKKSTVDQQQALANLLDDLITADPQTTNPQPMPSTTEEKTHNLNVCPFHKCSLILFEARTNENVYIKCQTDQCPIFMHKDSAYYYISNVCCKLHESYLKRKRILICGCEEAVLLRVSKTEKNPGRPYFETETVDSLSGQMWNYPRKIRKNKSNDSSEQSP